MTFLVSTSYDTSIWNEPEKLLSWTGNDRADTLTAHFVFPVFRVNRLSWKNDVEHFAKYLQAFTIETFFLSLPYRFSVRNPR